MTAQLALYGFVALVLSLVLTPLMKVIALRVGAVATPKADRWHREAVPLFGGIAICLSVVGAAAVMPIRATSIWILLAGAVAMAGVGLVDDLRPLKPQAKFVAQILAAATLASLGLRLSITGQPALDVLVTVSWIVAITNAINLLDNMDGLAAGIAAITALFRLGFLVLDGNAEPAAFTAIVVGALLGFLVYNFNPASIFMGDTGSLFLGVLIGGLSLIGGWPYSKAVISVLLFPVLILIVPIFDTTFVTLARMLAGRPISAGGRDHTSHRLVALGLTERHAVLLLYAVACLAGVVAHLAYGGGLSRGAVLITFLVLGVVLLGVYLGRVQVYPEGAAPIAKDTSFVTLVADLPYKRQVATVLVDVVLIVSAYYSAYILRFEQHLDENRVQFVSSLPLVLVCQLTAFAAFRTYQGVWRHVGFRDMVRLVQAGTVGTAGAVLVILGLNGFEGYSRTVFVLDWLLLVGFIAASRLTFRAFGEYLRPSSAGLTPVLVYGAGAGGLMVLREIRGNLELQSHVVGFIDDDRSKAGTMLQGVPVLGGIDELPKALEDLGIGNVIVSSRRIGAEQLARVHAICNDAGVPVVRATIRFE